MTRSAMYKVKALLRKVSRIYSRFQSKPNMVRTEEAKTYLCGNAVVVIKIGDLTEEETDAIVCPANSYNHMRGGVAGVIRQRGGDEIEARAREQAPVAIGHAVITHAGILPCKFVVHAPTMVDPIAPCPAQNARLAVSAALNCAVQHAVSSLSFPGMGTGTGGLGYSSAATAMLETIKEFLEQHGSIKEVRIVAVSKGFALALNAVAIRVLKKGNP